MNQTDERSTSPRKIGASRTKKEKIVAEISEKVNRAKAMIFTNYEGLTHKQLEGLKKAIRTLDAELMVTKNTLLKRSLEADKIKIVEEKYFQGPTAALFAYADVIAPLKELAKTIKTFKLPTIKFGIFEGKHLTGDEVLRLSVLPSREVLLTQLVFGLKSPIFGLHRSLNWNLQKLVLTLKAIEQTKEGGDK